MKSPTEIAEKLAKDWQVSRRRIERLLSATVWPLRFNIGKPSAEVFLNQPTKVTAHRQRWKMVTVGDVIWQEIRYRAGELSVSLPVVWQINKPSEWVEAADNPDVSDEYRSLAYLLEKLPTLYCSLLIQDRSLWRNKDLDEVLAGVYLAESLSPGCAHGRPLRLLAGNSVDTKFFERNRTLITRLLDQRYANAASEQGLETFLDAHNEKDHWLLIISLDPTLMLFRRIRLTTTELAEVVLPGTHLLLVENEQCAHLLPPLPNVLAVLGAGLDLQWLQAKSLDAKNLAYWGDIDTWGLLMLSRAKSYRPTLEPLLMDGSIFNRYKQNNAVVEPVPAGANVPPNLSEAESALYQYLLKQENGRLEQEFLPEMEVCTALSAWLDRTSSD